MFRIIQETSEGLRLRRHLGVLTLCLAVGSFAWAAQPTEKSTQRQEVVPRVTLSYRRVPLERVLDYISRSSRGVNVKIKVEDADEEEELKRLLITVELTNVPWRTAVEYIADKYKFVVNDDKLDSGLLLLEKPPRVTMSVQNAKLSKIIKMIAMGAGKNIIPGPAVSGIDNVSFDLQDVPWKEALQSILKTYGLVMVEEESGIIRIVSPASVQATHEVKAIQLKYLQPFGTRYRPLLPANDYVTASGDTGTGSGAVGSLLDVLNQLRSPDGAISYETRTNMLIIKDTATNIESMMEVVRSLDREPLQVKVNVKMVTVDATDRSNLGVSWQNGVHATVNGVSWQTVFPFSSARSGAGENWKKGGWGDLGPLAPMVSSDVGPLPAKDAWKYMDPDDLEVTVPRDTYTMGTLSFEQMSATLQILKSNNTSTVIQAPELVVLDNQEATIHMGEVIRYAEFYSDDTGSGYRESTPPVNLGVQLIVIPHVCGTEDKVIMEVVPKTEELDLTAGNTDGDPGWRQYGTGAGSISLPQTRSKVVVTKMMLRSRETGVIAGLVDSVLTDSMSKIPILGDIPILGYAFKGKNKTIEKKNLLIFVTPTVLGPKHGDNFKEDVESVRKLAADIGMPAEPLPEAAVAAAE